MTWTNEHLELYLDGELDATRHAGLTESLRCDPALRARLARLDEIDRLVVEAAVEDTPAARARGRRVTRVTWGSLAAAALVTVATAAVAIRLGREPAPAPVPPVPPDVYAPVRVVLSMRLPAREVLPEPAPAAPVPLVELEGPPFFRPEFLDRFDAVLEREGLLAASALIGAASPLERAHCYQRIGEAVYQSQAAAEDVLDAMTPVDQLAFCRQLIGGSQHLRLTMLRLKRLSEDPDVSEGVQRLVNELAADPQMRSWLRSYALVWET